MKNGTFPYGTTPNKAISNAIAELGDEPYNMSLVGEHRTLMTEIINQGIDSHLEAFTQSSFSDDGNRLHCDVGPNDMLILLRRLSAIPHGLSFRSDILYTLEIEEI